MVFSQKLCVYCLQVLEEQCLALEPKLQELNSSYELLADVSHSAEESGAWEGGEGGEGGDEDDALREKQEAEKRYKDLLDALHEEKEQVHSEITKYIPLLSSISHHKLYYFVLQCAGIPRCV